MSCNVRRGPGVQPRHPRKGTIVARPANDATHITAKVDQTQAGAICPLHEHRAKALHDEC